MRLTGKISMLLFFALISLSIICLPASAEEGLNVATSTISIVTLTPGTTWDDYLELDYSASISGGTASSWSWNFGDGSTSSDKSGTHTYSKNGSYKVTLTATSSDSKVDNSPSQIVKISEPAFDVSSANTVIKIKDVDKLEMSYESTAKGAASWSWDFGDGKSSTAQSGTHTYDKTGSYLVNLTATSKEGTVDSYTKTIKFDIGPTAYFTVADRFKKGGRPHYVRFEDDSDASSKADIDKWYWDFDYGTKDYEFDADDKGFKNADTEFTYNSVGNYTVTLTVKDDDGYKNSYSRVIEVVDDKYAPRVDFEIDDDYSDRGAAPFKVRFNDLSKESIDKEYDDSDNDLRFWYWEFYDEDNDDIDMITSRSEDGPTITFKEAGVYTARLTVVDDDGIAATKIKRDYIRVTSQKTATRTATHTKTATPVVTYTTMTTAIETEPTVSAGISASPGTTIFGIPGTEYFRTEMGRFYNFYEEYKSIIAGFFGMG